jgi:hypothetical protein
LTDEQIQGIVLAFLDARGGYVAGASERELFLMVKQACADERERCARSGICQQCRDGDTPTYDDGLRTYYHGASLCEAREIWALESRVSPTPRQTDPKG